MKKWHSEEKDGYILIINDGGAVLGYSKDSGVSILEQDGYAFKDLNQNGLLDPYEDWRLPLQDRVNDLIGRMDLDSKLGLSLHDGMFMVMHLTDEALRKNPFLKARIALMGKTPQELASMDPAEPTDYHRELIEHDEMRFWLMSAVDNPESAARFNNRIQQIAEGHKLGIPVWFSTNPRAFRDAHSDTSENDVSCWPSNLGMGATFDPAIAGQMAQTVSREYRAMGITLELGPQVDLASDPRWNRMSATFGSDPQLNADMARAVCDGLQTTPDAPESARGWGRHSVLAMTKHWPGSTGEGGRESHKESGKYAVYPGGNFDSHLYPWTAGAFCLDGPTSQCGAVMSCYDSIWEIGGKDADLSGASFNPYIINKLLREKYHFDGFVCTDFWITGNLKKERTTRPQVNAWGYEKVSAPERALREWESGVDQCGGTNEIEVMREAYQLALQKHGPAWAEQRINEIAELILTFGFRVGSFDNPYADPVYAHDFVGNQKFRSLGMDAHRKSIILLKNRNILPLKKGAKVWVAEKYEGGIPDRAGNISPVTLTSPLSQEETAGFFTRADNPESADFALVFMDSPKSGDGFDDKTGEYLPISLQYRPYTADTAREESISGNFTDGVKQNRSYRGKTVTTYNEYDLDQLLKVRQQMSGKPVILVLTCANPAVPAEFEPCADAILVGFAGTPNQILLEAVCGCFEPSGLLPFQMPASMETVEAHSEDTSGDMIPYTDEVGHVWDFGYGMNWSGVICDDRLEKYCKGK